MAARSGAPTLLLTQNLETIGQMSCNPAIGGIAKGTVVREVDALGGIMGRATDMARVQFRMLNRSKGPAVWSPRAQCDRGLYRRAVRTQLERLPALAFAQGTVADLLLEHGRVAGVITSSGLTVRARAVVLTAGTFLRGRIHTGHDAGVPAGRAGEAPAVEIAQAIENIGLTVKRFKTGTPPRVDGRSVDVGKMARQDGDPIPYWFSSHERLAHPRQLPCYLTYAGPELKAVIQHHLSESALYGGVLSGRGPRYCPSIEDKIVKFPDAERHQVFLEPEGLDTSELYVNGLSTSLPASVQLEFLRTVPGLESVHMTRPGYAIEYDYFPPTQLDHSLQVREIPGLFFAGQINGTTGYEEAAGQGVAAGLNAAASAAGRAPVVFRRDEAFIGVLVDDLVSRGVDEPYRLFTSRSEFRLLLRQDNALRRLLPKAESLELLNGEELAAAQSRLHREERVRDMAAAITLSECTANPTLVELSSPLVVGGSRIADLARRPEVPLERLFEVAGSDVAAEDCEWADIELKYAGYLAREATAAARVATLDEFPIPSGLEYRTLTTLSWEAREKLAAQTPTTIGHASRIPGVSPSDVQTLLMEIARNRKFHVKQNPSSDAVSRETGV